MFWRILKKDLKRKKTMTLVFLAFMILCSLFLSSNAANIAATQNAITSFFDVSKVADQYYFSSSYFDEEVDAWLTSCPYVESYEKSSMIIPNREDIEFKGENFEQNIFRYYYFTTANCEYSLFFDENDKVVTSVAPGEMAMSAIIAKKLGLKKGDFLDIRIGSEIRSLKLTTLTKDVFTKENISDDRILLSHQDYADLSANNQNKMTQWAVMASDLENLRRDCNKNIPVYSELTRSDLLALSITETISSFILVVVAGVMILIALVLLQFAIRFTIEEDFREIGMMKAIGIKTSDVRWMYIIKYLAISVTGTTIGLAASLPFGDFLISPLKEIMVIPRADFSLGKVPGLDIRLLCALGVVALTLLFCWRATHSIAKMSPIQAIREGASGERFRPKGIIKLRGSRTKAVLFLAANDILSGLRSFIPIFLALSFGMLIIILPANIASTLRSETTLEFNFFSRTDAYSDSSAGIWSAPSPEKTYSELKAVLRDTEREFSDKGIQIKVDAITVIPVRIYKDDQLNGITVPGFKRISNSDTPADVPYFAGRAPKLTNEIAITDILMKKLNVQLGDKVLLDFGQEAKKYIITGQIQVTNGNGHALIFSPLDEPALLYHADFLLMLIDFIDRNDIPGQVEKTREAFPEYNMVTAKGMLRNMLGGTIDTLNSLAVFLFFVSLIIVCLVVYLISHALLAKDTLAIVFLKSIGFSNGAIRSWQILRTMIVSIAGVLFGIGLSFILNPLVTKITFGAAGADRVPPQYDVLWTFIMYPALTLIGVLITAILASLGISKISIRNTGRPESCPPSPNCSSTAITNAPTSTAITNAPTSAAITNQKKGTSP